MYDSRDTEFYIISDFYNGLKFPETDITASGSDDGNIKLLFFTSAFKRLVVLFALFRFAREE